MTVNSPDTSIIEDSIMFDDTYFFVWRSIADNRVFADPYLFKVYMWCLSKAAHKSHPYPIQTGKGYHTINLEIGEFVFGRNTASEILAMSPSSVERRMKKLEKMEKIVRKVNTHFTLVTVCNFKERQLKIEESEQASEQPMNNQRTPNEHLMNTNNKDNKEKNVNNENKNKSGKPATPVPEDVRSVISMFSKYLDERGLHQASKESLKTNKVQKAGVKILKMIQQTANYPPKDNMTIRRLMAMILYLRWKHLCGGDDVAKSFDLQSLAGEKFKLGYFENVQADMKKHYAEWTTAYPEFNDIPKEHPSDKVTDG